MCMPKKPAKIKAKSKYIDEYRKERKRVRDFISRARRKGEIIPADVLPPIPKRITQGSINRLKKLTAKALHEKATTYINTVTGEVLPEGSTVVKQRREIKKAKEKEKKDLEKELEELKKKMKELEKENEELKKELEKQKEKEEPEKPEEPEEPKDRGFHGAPGKPEEPEDEPVDIDTKTYETILEEINQWDPLSGWSPSLAAAKEDDVNILRSILEGAIQSQGFENVMKRLNDHASEVAELTEKILYAYGPGESYDAGIAMVQECLTRFTEILYGGMLDAEQTRSIVDDVENHRNVDWWEDE